MSTERYDNVILEIVQVINSANVSQTHKGEFFGYLLDHLIHRYVQMPEGRGDQFNANLFPAGTRKALDLLVQRLASLICTSDPVEMAKDLRYIIVKVIDGVSAQNVAVGMNLFLKGCICKTLTKVQQVSDSALGTDSKERVMASRRRVIALGVLTDVLSHGPHDEILRRLADNPGFAKDVWDRLEKDRTAD